MHVSVCITIQLEGLMLPCFCCDWAGRRTGRNCRVHPGFPSSSLHSYQHAQMSAVTACPLFAALSLSEQQCCRGTVKWKWTVVVISAFAEWFSHLLLVSTLILILTWSLLIVLAFSSVESICAELHENSSVNPWKGGMSLSWMLGHPWLQCLVQALDIST